MRGNAMSGRPLRADAQSNHDRLLEVAAEAFAADGVQTSLKAIAQRAGVGIGTLYRRFPTRETLVEAVYRNEVARLCGSVPTLLETLPPVEALRAWMEKFVDFMAAKQGMSQVLRSVLLSGEDRMQTRGLLRDALAGLLGAGVQAGMIRPGVDPYDVLMGLGGIALIAGEESRRDLASRLIVLALDGVTVR
jgi:AcrR family transcriptional regulator